MVYADKVACHDPGVCPEPGRTSSHVLGSTTGRVAGSAKSRARTGVLTAFRAAVIVTVS